MNVQCQKRCPLKFYTYTRISTYYASLNYYLCSNNFFVIFNFSSFYEPLYKSSKICKSVCELLYQGHSLTNKWWVFSSTIMRQFKRSMNPFSQSDSKEFHMLTNERSNLVSKMQLIKLGQSCQLGQCVIAPNIFPLRQCVKCNDVIFLNTVQLPIICDKRLVRNFQRILVRLPHKFSF